MKVGTIFEDSAIPLDKWLTAMWMMANCKNGLSSWEIHRIIGVTQKSAWFVLQRLRLALQTNSTGKLGGSGGEVEVDETFIGGKARNMHMGENRCRKINATGTGGKAAVLGLLERGGKGTYMSVEPFHLFRYLDEQAWRYNNCATKDRPMTDSDCFDLAVSKIVRKRLTCAEVTGKVGETIEPF